MRITSLLALGLLASGCASFTHQESPEAPHAVLKIKRTNNDPDSTEQIVKLDGHRIYYFPGIARSYRVTPGEHTLTVEVKRREIRFDPYGGVEELIFLAGTLAGAQGNRPGSRYTVTSYSYISKTITVESGGVYLLEGLRIVKQTKPSNRLPENSPSK